MTQIKKHRIVWCSTCRLSVVDPVAAVVFPAVKLVLTKPQRDFLLGALYRVAAMDHIPATQSRHRHVRDRINGSWSPRNRKEYKNLSNLLQHIIWLPFDNLIMFYNPVMTTRATVTLLWYSNRQDFRVREFMRLDWILPAHFHTVVSSDGSRQRVRGVRLSQHFTCCLDHVQTLPHLNQHRNGNVKGMQYNITILVLILSVISDHIWMVKYIIVEYLS